MNKLLSEFARDNFMVFFCVLFLLASGCVHQSSKNKTPKSPIQSDSLEQGKIVAEQAWKLEFSEDFSGVDIGAEPENIFILDGEYTVLKDRDDNKCLTLPGTPMGDFGLLFGPREREKPLELNFAFFATKKGRRMPSIAASIGGVRGYRLRLNPAARNIVVSMHETVLKQLSFAWEGDQWWRIRFQAIPVASKEATRLQIKLWPKAQNEPKEWFLREEFDIAYTGGKCALWGFPYSSTPILFDDITVLSN